MNEDGCVCALSNQYVFIIQRPTFPHVKAMTCVFLTQHTAKCDCEPE